ncbi:MAG: T9SS type A sorting domain-containing protein [Cyclobacteriaceae bacterium]|nr:T9SS type A sorting domain-containing protein [Cyclobacteriaceae bacterium]
MKNILATLLILFSVVGFSQTKVQLEVENENGKEQYKLKLEREVDGKTVITEKIYNSKEEMQNDPELKDLNLHIMRGDDLSFTSKEGGKHIMIKMEQEGDGKDHKIMVFTDAEEGEDGKEVNIEITVDEDGTKHVFKNGEEISIDELHGEGVRKMIFISKDGEDFDVKELEGEGRKIMFISEETDGDGEVKIEVTVDEDGTKHVFKNGEEIDFEELQKEGENVFVFRSDGDHRLVEEESMEVKVIMDEDGNPHVTVNGEEVYYDPDSYRGGKNNELHMASGKMVRIEDGGSSVIKEVIIFKGEDGDEKDVKVEVIIQKMVLHLEDVNAEDEKAFSIEDSKNLKLDEFNFYPNPSNGTFNLKFAGKEKSTMVRVTDINGKEVYAEDLQNFSGIYDKEINLAGLKKGIYLLQVVQGSKVVNKKIVIE